MKIILDSKVIISEQDSMLPEDIIEKSLINIKECKLEIKKSQKTIDECKNLIKITKYITNKNIIKSVFCGFKRTKNGYIYRFYDKKFFNVHNFSKKYLLPRTKILNLLDKKYYFRNCSRYEIFEGRVEEDSCDSSGSDEEILTCYKWIKLCIYDRYGTMIKKKTFRNYINVVINNNCLDPKCKLYRPYKIKIKNNKARSYVKYYGHDIKLLELHFCRKMKFEDIFDDSKLDKNWCNDNMDKIKQNSKTCCLVM